MNHAKQILCLSALLTGLVWPGAAIASTVYTVTADTSAIAGTDGYLDLQFEPSPVTPNLATAVVTGFSTDGTLTGAASLTGDVTGQLPGALTFDNQTVFNDYFQETTFGNTETFTVTLNGPTPMSGSSSAFNIAFYGSDGATPLLTDSPDGEAGQIILYGDGSTSVQLYPPAAGEQPVLTITPAVTAPEPATGALIALAFGSIGFWIRKSRLIARR